MSIFDFLVSSFSSFDFGLLLDKGLRPLFSFNKLLSLCI